VTKVIVMNDTVTMSISLTAARAVARDMKTRRQQFLVGSGL